jgi:hypothetical protein
MAVCWNVKREVCVLCDMHVPPAEDGKAVRRLIIEEYTIHMA